MLLINEDYGIIISIVKEFNYFCFMLNIYLAEAEADINDVLLKW